ncbi:hypothetical protein FRC03_007553 [Tulasnella sp. 419]|nr:hypothetical protein FRC03_007553 [Tulasnella sp. 419]
MLQSLRSMAPEEVWSDSESDDEDLGEIETSVLLGLTDGPISSPEDLVDPAVSRLGGIPVSY